MRVYGPGLEVPDSKGVENESRQKNMTFVLLKAHCGGTRIGLYDDMAGLEDAGGTNFGSALSGLAATPALRIF